MSEEAATWRPTEGKGRTSVMRGPAAKGGAVMDIQHFDKEMKKAEPGISILSHMFNVQNKPFVIMVFPNGRGSWEKGNVYIGIIYVKDGEDEVEMAAEVDMDVESVKVRATSWGGTLGEWKELAPEWVGSGIISNWASHAAMKDNMKDNVFEVEVEVELLGKRVTVGPDTSIDTHAKAQFASNIKSLLSDAEHADFVLKCGGKSFKCHKAVLSTRSPVFRGMLALGMEEVRRADVEIKDMKPETLGKLLAFLYSGEVEEELGDQEEVELLLYAADKYDLGDLVKLCAAKFRGGVTPRTAARILLLADRHGLAALKQVVMNRVLQEKVDFMADAKFKKDMSENPKLLIELFSM